MQLSKTLCRRLNLLQTAHCQGCVQVALPDLIQVGFSLGMTHQKQFGWKLHRSPIYISCSLKMTLSRAKNCGQLDKSARVISASSRKIDDKMGGGVPYGSMILIRGGSHSGKPVLTQQITWGLLYRVRTRW